MSESNSNNIIRVMKLGEATYRQWYNTLIDVLEALELDQFISTFKYERAATDPPINRKEINKIAKVRNIIKQSISKDDLEGLMDYRNPKEMLEELERKYRGPGAKSAWELLKDLETIKFDGSIPALFSRMRQLYAAFADKDIKLPCHIINSKVRSVLPPEYTDMCKMLDIYNGGRKESDYMSDKQFESELLRFDREKNLTKSSIQSTSLAATSTPESSNANAATAANTIAVPPVLTSPVLSASSSNRIFLGKCYFCGMQGHIERFCQQKKYAEMNRNNYRNGYNNNRNGYNNDCNRSNDDRNCNNYNRQNNDLTSLSAIVSSKQHGSLIPPPSSLSLCSVSSVKFLADCGASFHVVNNRSFLTNIRRTNESISTLKGEIRNPEKGDMFCQLFNGQRWIPMKIKDVFLVDDQPFNLISIGKFCNVNGISESMDRNGMVIYHYRKPILIGKWSTDYVNLIELQIRVNVSPIRNVANTAVKSFCRKSFGHSMFENRDTYVPLTSKSELRSSVEINEQPMCSIPKVNEVNESNVLNDSNNFMNLDNSIEDDTDDENDFQSHCELGQPGELPKSQYHHDYGSFESLCPSQNIANLFVAKFEKQSTNKMSNNNCIGEPPDYGDGRNRKYGTIGKSFKFRKFGNCNFSGIGYFRNKSSRSGFLHHNFLNGNLGTPL
uniref:Uncharacterized protein LOC113792498 n=1 Tax=Dermatophagoides pteronyssinus TaxID=6956 RepID=A0A6P6XY00_DERPT|nr:uncharacterized protein LOC113792498 [Dermatophagoides pteronyssinus]